MGAKVELHPGETCPYCGQKKRGGWKCPKSAENGKKGGRPKKQYTAEQIRNGMVATGTPRFIVSVEGEVFRQNHNGNYICVGHTEADSEKRTELLIALRTAKRTGASEKEAAGIIKDFANEH